VDWTLGMSLACSPAARAIPEGKPVLDSWRSRCWSNGRLRCLGVEAQMAVVEMAVVHSDGERARTSALERSEPSL
jgi:hypothetical protein